MAAVYIRNCCYSQRVKKTPYEAFTSQKLNLQNMHIFGTICLAYVQDKKKLDARGERRTFMGYNKGSLAYLVYFPKTGLIKRYRCVRFTDKFESQVESSKANIHDEGGNACA
jgi:hypothetical protein